MIPELLLVWFILLVVCRCVVSPSFSRVLCPQCAACCCARAVVHDGGASELTAWILLALYSVIVPPTDRRRCLASCRGMLSSCDYRKQNA